MVQGILLALSVLVLYLWLDYHLTRNKSNPFWQVPLLLFSYLAFGLIAGHFIFPGKDKNIDLVIGFAFSGIIVAIWLSNYTRKGFPFRAGEDHYVERMRQLTDESKKQERPK